MNTNIGIKIEEIDGITVFSIEGHFDASMTNAVNEKVQDILQSDSIKIIFELSELNYISSSGLRILLFVAKKIKAKNGKVLLCSVDKNVQRILDISGLTELLPSCENVEAAIDSMKSP